MNRHASMNRIYRLVWSQVRSAWVSVAEKARGRGKSAGARSATRLKAATAAAALPLACVPLAHAGPTGGQIVSGNGTITQSGSLTDIHQSSQSLSINWLTFNIAPQETVDFIQPSASAVAVNRIGGTNGSQILGHLDANGQVYLINPNGVLFGQGAEVNVGGLVASTLDLSDAGLEGATRSFSGSGTGSIVNEGTITAAQGGYVALLGNHVANNGTITAQLGTVSLGAGNAATLTFSGDSLVHLQVDRSVLGSLAANGGLIQADGGQVILTAGAKDALLASVVNNTGVIEARTVDNHDGTISLLGGMTAGTVNVGGTLDASAPEGGNGGFIETSAAHVEVSNQARITTAASRGLTGSWLIDPQDFTIAPSGGDITGATLSSELATTSVTLESSAGAQAGTGSINVDDTVSWSANTLTLTAADNINVNSVMTATGSASLAMNPSTANGADAAVSGGTVVMGLTGSGFTGQVNFSGTGTLSIGGTPYTVINSLGAPGSTTGTDLQGINGNLSGNFALGSNINATPTSSWNAGAGFTPIGTSGTPFSGQLDGLGHTIANLYINSPTTNDVGLFGAIAASGASAIPAVVRNVGVSGSVSGASDVGGLVGFNSGGIVTNSYTTTNVSGSGGMVGGLVGNNVYGGNNNTGSTAVISNSHATGNVTGANEVGGLVGFNYHSNISNSYATGIVKGTGNDVGGLVGGNYGDQLSGPNGFFGYVSNSYATGNVTGSNYVGGLIGGQFFGQVSNSRATGNVTGAADVGGLVGLNNYAGFVVNSYATGKVNGTSAVGGLVGDGYYSTVSNSYATGIVKGTGNDVGGLAGDNDVGTISNSYATGNVTGSAMVGGLVGSSSYSISNSYSTGKVSGTSTAGGLVGSNTGTVNSSYWNVTTSGQSTSSGGTGLTTAQMLNAANFAGFTFTVTPGATGNNWVIVDTDGTLNNAGGAAGATFPMLASEYSTTINNAHQLQLMAMNPAASYTLGQSINAAATSSGGDVWSSTGFAPVGNFSTPFSGSLNGAGYTISNLSINLPSQSSVGLIGVAGPTALIRNIGLIGGSVTGGAYYVGALVGYNEGTVSNSYATLSVTGNSFVGGLIGMNAYGSVSNSYATGNASGTSGASGTNHIGGLVGENYLGTINNSYATGSATGDDYVGGLAGSSYQGSIVNSYATGQVTGLLGVGGLVGWNFGTVSNSYAIGSVSGLSHAGGLSGYNYGTINNSYAAGSVNGASYVGGLVGYNSGTVSNSFWNVTTSGQTASAGGLGMTTANMQTQANFTSATTANGNVNPNWDFTNTWVMYNGYTYPLLRSFMTPLTVTANGLAETYNGAAFSGGNGVTYSVAPNSNLLGTVTYSGSSQGAVNVGSYTITPGGLYSNQQGYIISYASGNLTINQLASVAWTGGSTGNWSNAANWAGGAIPDYSNVAAVTIPAGVTVTYDSGVPGSTLLSTLTSSGNLIMSAGTLGTTGNLSTAGFQQTGGTLNVGGSLSIQSVSGGVTLGNLTAGSLSINSTAGAITQLASTALSITGASSLTADNGVSGAGDVKYNVTLANSANAFGGTVISDGLNIDLLDTAASGLILGNTTASGTLTAISRDGAITQAASTALDVAGTSNVSAYNGVSGAGKVKYDVTLANSANDFGGAVSSNGLDIDLLDTGAGGLTLGNTTASGTLTAISRAGAITQAASTALDITGTSNVSAYNGVSGAGKVKYDVTLANSSNDFGGAVASNGLDIDLLDSGASGLILGNTTASGTLTATSLAGAITQAASTTVAVTGATTLTAKDDVTLANTTNSLKGAVSAAGTAITLDDDTALTASLDSTAAVSLTAAGAMNVSGTIGTNLTTVTTGTDSTTTFGDTTVGKDLNVTSTGAVATAASDTLTVDGKGTTSPNKHVTVNGVNDVAIPVQ